MNSRKFISTIAAGVIAATTVITPSVTFGYSSELESAYTWAYDNGVTTVKGIDNANMMGNLTRVAMAKMLANYAINKLGRTPDTSITCNFSDVSAKMDADYDNGVTKACQLGIMGRDEGKVASSFNPNGIVTRAQFGTALSRVLWPNQVKDTNPYYVNHLNALKKAGIMTQINPDQKEVRGYVMIMLQRSAGMINNEKTEECSVAQQFLCILEEGDCPEACEGVVNNNNNNNNQNNNQNNDVKEGKLTVTNDKNDDALVISQGYTTELDTINFKADRKVTIDSITLERMGLSSNDAIEAIRLEDENGAVVANEKSLSTSKDTVQLTIKKDYRTIDEKGSFVIVVRTAKDKTSDKLGTNIGFQVANVESSAEVKINTSVNKYSFGDYNGDEVIVSSKTTATTKTYNYVAGEPYEIAKFKVEAKSAAIMVDGFTIMNTGSVRLSDIENVIVSVNGESIKSSFSVKGDDLKVSFAEQEIAMRRNATFTVEVVLSSDFNDFGKNLHFYMEEPSKINMYEAKNSSVRVNVASAASGSTMLDGTATTTYTFNGGKVILTNGDLDTTVDAAQDSQGTVIAQGKIEINGQSIKNQKITVVVTDDAGNDYNGIEEIHFYMDDSEIASATPDATT